MYEVLKAEATQNSYVCVIYFRYGGVDVITETVEGVACSER